MEKGKVHFLHQMKMVFISLMTITPMNLFATHRHVIGQLNPKNEVLLDKKGLSQCIFRQKWFKTYVQIVVRIPVTHCFRISISDFDTTFFSIFAQFHERGK